MATKQTSTAAPTRSELEHESYVGGDYYTGTREQIIAAGVAKGGMFPGDPGRGKTSATFRDPRLLRIERLSKNRFRAFLEPTAEVSEARADKHAAAQALRQAQANVERQLVDLPADRAAYRKTLHTFAASLRRQFLLIAGYRNGGYALAPEDIEGINEAWAEVVDVVASARITFSAEHRARHIAAVRGEASRADAPFQAFLAVATAGAIEVAEPATADE